MNSTYNKFRKVVKIITVFIVIVFFGGVYAEVPDHINYQGKLKDNTGTPITSATTIQFSLYNHLTNGTSADVPSSGGPLLWTEIYDQATGNCSEITPGVDGIFAQLLGTCVSFPSYLDFTNEYYLGVKIGTDAEATPRVPLATNPYAYTSKSVHTEGEDLNIATATSGNILFNTAAGMIINTSNVSFQGAVYAADYSANFVDRSLVDKAYVDRLHNSTWDSDKDTGIQVEESADEDIIRFDTFGTQRMAIDSNGHIVWSNSEPADMTNPGVLLGMLFRNDKAAMRVGETTGTEWNDSNIGNGSFAAGHNNIASGNYSISFGGENTSSGVYASSLGRYNNASGSYSIVGGNNNIASGYASSVFGQTNQVTDRRAMAWGIDNIASQDEATSWGRNTRASANYATSWGRDSVASGELSTAFGYQNNATNDYGLAFGYRNNASGRYATAWGGQNTASGQYSTTWGSHNTASGAHSTAIGYYSSATAENATAIGDALANSNYMTAIGRFNKNVSGQSLTNWVDTDQLFVIGNGTGWQDSDRSNALTILKNGTITAPTFSLAEINTAGSSALVTKEYVDQQLMWEIVGDRIQPKNNSVKQIYVEENSNSYTQFKVVNTNDTGNGAGAIIELKGSGADYTNNMYIGKYGASFWIPELQDNGAVLTDKDLVIGTASSSHEIHFVTGNSYTNLQPVVIADDEGFRYTSDLSATFVDRTLVDKAYVDGAILTGANTLYLADGTLSGDRTVTSNGNTLTFTGSGGNSWAFEANDAPDTSFLNINPDEIEFSASNGVTHAVMLFNTGGSSVNFQNAAGNSSLTIGNNMTFLDAINNRGVVYSADYSANFVDRSLVDKAYVDSHVGTSIFDSDSDTGIQVERTADDDNVYFQVFGHDILRLQGNNDGSGKILQFGDYDEDGNGTKLGINDTNSSINFNGLIATFGDSEGNGNDSQFSIDDVNQVFTTNNVNIVVGQDAAGTGSLRFEEQSLNGNNYVGFIAPNSLAANQIWTLPDVDGNANEALVTDGAGNLSWETFPATVTASNGLTRVGNDIQLGGTLNSNTWLTTGHGAELFVGRSDTYVRFTGGSFYLYDIPSDKLSFYSADGINFVDNNLNENLSLDYVNGDSWHINASNASTFKGFVYDADYSANFVDRSLVDKAYVDNLVSSSSSNIYIADGALTGDRTVDLNGNDLYFNGSGSIGIGTTSPSTKLQVVGQVRATSFANANGTGGSPSYRFVNDANTGMFLANTDELGFTTAGNERLRIDNNGFVGIGTDDPTSFVHIQHDVVSTESLLKLENTAGNTDFFVVDSNPENNVVGNLGNLAFDSTNGELYLKNSGNATNTGWLRMLRMGDNLGVTDQDADTWIKTETSAGSDEDVIVAQANQTGNNVMQEWRDGNGDRMMALDADGDLHLGGTNYPSKSKLYFGHDHFNIGSYNNGRDFEFYSTNGGGGGNEGFRFNFNNGGMLNIRSQGSNIELSTFDKDNMIMFTTPYDSTTSALSELAPQFSPRGGGYYPNVSDKVLTIRNWDETTADNATIKTKAFFTRQGNLSIGTSDTSLSDGVRASLTIQNGSYAVLGTDGSTQAKVRTASGGGTSATFPAYPNTAIPIQIHVGTKLTANGETRTVVAMPSKTSLTLDSAVDWWNGGSGYDVSYQNPYVDFLDESMSSVFKVDGNGNVGIGVGVPSQKLQVGTNGDGTVAVANAWNTFSDRRWKKNINNLENSLNKILSLRGVSYDWKNGGTTNNIGFIAQELQEVYPDLVSEDSNGYLSISYSKLVAPIIESIKEIWNKVIGIEEKVEEIDTLKIELCEKDDSYSWCNQVQMNDTSTDSNGTTDDNSSDTSGDQTNDGGDTSTDNDQSGNTSDGSGDQSDTSDGNTDVGTSTDSNGTTDDNSSDTSGDQTNDGGDTSTDNDQSGNASDDNSSDTI